MGRYKMKFILPKSIPILGHKIKIKVVDTQDYAGLWDYSVNTVFISINQSPEQMEETFWHELNHCIQWHTALNQAIPRELLETMAEMNSRILPGLIRKLYRR